MRKPILWALLVPALLAFGLAASRCVHYVPEGDLAVARSGDSSRYLPPGLHLINPLRETLDLIPSGSFPIAGISSLVTADGIPVRVPFSARVSLLPREFEASTGALGGEHPRGVVTRGMEEALAAWGMHQPTAYFLAADPGRDLHAPLAQACRQLGIRLESIQLQRPDPDVYVFLAEDALSHGDSEPARTLVAAAQQRYPDDSRVVTATGLLHEGSGDWQAAEAAYLRALALQPGLEAPLGRLFLRYQAERRHPELQELLEAARVDNPSSVRLLNWQALMYVESEQFPAAFDTLQRALELDPRNEVTLQNLASLHLKLGRAPDAVGVYQQARKANPRSQPILLGLGVAEMARGDLAAARAALESARDLGPSTIPLHNALAQMYGRFGLFEQAVAELQASLLLDPQQEVVRRELVRVLDSAAQSPDDRR